MTTVAILGPGAIGGLLAARLGQAGHDVTLIGRHPVDVTVAGLTLAAPGEDAITTRPASRPYLTEPAGVLIVAVKATQLVDATARVPAALVTGATVIPFLNGVDHLPYLRAVYPADTVAGTIVVDRAQSLMSGNVPFGSAEQFAGPEYDALKAQRRRGLVIVVIVVVLVSSSLTWWAWATSRADHQAKQQAVALESALKGLKPYQVLQDPGRSLGPNVNLVTMFGDPFHVVIQAQPRSLPHLRCVVANLDASGRYDVQIKDAGCGGR